MKSFISKIIALVMLAGVSSAQMRASSVDSASLIVSTRQGMLRGILADSIRVWKGIPYAAQPVGALRFRAPQPPVSWQGVRDASRPGHISPQSRRATKIGGSQGEDCLSLNVWSPAADGRSRPVMLWIHGGGFLVGSGSIPMYDGASLAKKDVVVVTINYRLGPLGFLYFNDIKGSQTGFDDNLGIRDQVAALQWVHDNIAAFGGDPDQVTIFGESAGAISVLTLMSMPSAHGLFKRAIVESATPEALIHPAVSTELTLRYLRLMHISPDSLSLLKKANIDTMVSAMFELVHQLMTEPTSAKLLSPTIDGSLIPTDPISAIAAGQAAGIDLLIGTNKDEATLLALKRIGLTPRNVAQLQPYLAGMTAERREGLIATYKHYPHRTGVMEMTTDGIFTMPSIRLAELQSRFASTYMYRFDRSTFALDLVGLRACHGAELPFVFGSLDKKPGKYFVLMSNKKVNRAVSNHMQQSWVNFARYGNPDPGGQLAWAKYNSAERSTMIFDSTCHASTDPKSEQRIAWTGLSIFR